MSLEIELTRAHERVRNIELELERVKSRLEAEKQPRRVLESFHKIYYENPWRTWFRTNWLGVPVFKCPLDLWVYQEIVHERSPDVIVETGTAFGGSALYLATVLDTIGKGGVTSIDIAESFDGKPRPQHERITYLKGSSTNPEILKKVRQMIPEDGEVLVILDSDHSAPHVLAELKAYAPLIRPGGYLVVEDTNINGHPVLPEHGPGPMEALKEFFQSLESEGFQHDSSREKYYLTFNPMGYLQKNV